MKIYKFVKSLFFVIRKYLLPKKTTILTKKQAALFQEDICFHPKETENQYTDWLIERMEKKKAKKRLGKKDSRWLKEAKRLKEKSERKRLGKISRSKYKP